MAKVLDLTGKTFARLTVVGRSENRGKEARWKCLCECGNQSIVFGLSLKSGKTKSCGCLAKEITAKRSITHGMWGTSIWRAWTAMKARCSTPSLRSYKDYGGRGISVCSEWESSFEAFFKDMGPKPTPAHQLDRIDNDGGYCPENCQWVTATANMNNRRNTKRYAGLTIREWSDKTGENYNTLKTRNQRGKFNP